LEKRKCKGKTENKKGGKVYQRRKATTNQAGWSRIAKKGGRKNTLRGGGGKKVAKRAVDKWKERGNRIEDRDDKRKKCRSKVCGKKGKVGVLERKIGLVSTESGVATEVDIGRGKGTVGLLIGSGGGGKKKRMSGNKSGQ